MNTRRTIGRLSLTLLMVSMVAVPIGFGLLLYSMTEHLGEPPLPAEVKISTIWVGSSEESQRLVPCIKVRNISAGDWKKLSVGVNEQFYSTGNMAVPAQSEVSLPLEAFIARNGSVRFPVGNRPIKHIIVMAQLPNGSRGISEYIVDPASNSEPTDWMIAKPKSSR